MAWLFASMANFGDETCQLVFGIFLWIGILYLGIDNIFLSPRRKKRELDKLVESAKSNQTT